MYYSKVSGGAGVPARTYLQAGRTCWGSGLNPGGKASLLHDMEYHGLLLLWDI